MSTRPDVIVCPSAESLRENLSRAFQTWEFRPATGDYALSMGHRGPTWQRRMLPVKLDNSGSFLYNRGIRLSELEDGASSTFFCGETIEGEAEQHQNIWTLGERHTSSLRTTDNPLNTPPGQGKMNSGSNGAFQSRHPRGANFAFGDGHVEFISEDIDLAVYQAYSTRAEDEKNEKYPP
jgi:prepilin-type processing-associated H-X9-DG protein